MRRTLAIAVAALVAGGCGSNHGPPLFAACSDAAAVKQAALGARSLSGATPLSDCVAAADSDAALLNVSTAFVQAADELTAMVPGSPRAARGLGFLIGAAQREADPTNGVEAQLGERLTADRRRAHEAAPRRDDTVTAGMAVGKAHG